MGSVVPSMSQTVKPREIELSKNTKKTEEIDENFRTRCHIQQGTGSEASSKVLRLNAPIILGSAVLAALSFFFIRSGHAHPVDWAGGGSPRGKFSPGTLTEALRLYSPVGLLYGWLAIACWITTTIQHHVIRLGMIIFAAIGVILLVPQLSTLSTTESGAFVTMFTMLVCIGVQWGNVLPFASISSRNNTSDSLLSHGKLRPRQFTIRNVMILTTGVALSLFLIGRSAVDANTPAVKFWAVYLLTAIIISASVILLFRMADPDTCWKTKASCFVSSIGVMLCLVTMLSTLGDLSRPDKLRDYGSLLAGTWGLAASFSALVSVNQPRPARATQSSITT